MEYDAQKSEAMGMTQQVEPILIWLGEAAIEPQQGIIDLIRLDNADSTLAQR